MIPPPSLPPKGDKCCKYIEGICKNKIYFGNLSYVFVVIGFMRIYKVLKMGAFHTVFCEDFLLEVAFNERIHIAAVMDGCSMGRDTHFVSTLLAKLLHKHIRSLSYLDWQKSVFTSLEDLARLLLQRCWADLKFVQNDWLLEVEELLSTLSLLVLDRVQKTAFVVMIGDGVFAINDKIIHIDQDDKPDYLAYHLSENFEDWFAALQNTFFVEEVVNIALATDGIETFMNREQSFDFGFDVVGYLLQDTSFADGDMLARKCNFVKERYGAVPTDDLAIIRLATI